MRVTAPFHGVVTVLVRPGQQVGSGDRLATIEAMKLEAVLTAPVAGRVDRVLTTDGADVDGGDVVVTLRP